MSGSPELLEFYLVEATEYLDALDQLVAGATTAPVGNAFIATARALRGSSTMAKASEIAEIALILEQLAHAAGDGDLEWSEELREAMRGAVDDLRQLVRSVRTWGAREDTRAAARIAALRRFLPQEGERTEAPSARESAPVFLALQASAIAAELDTFVANPANRGALDEALVRARTMRGIAGIAEHPPLSDVADAMDRVARLLMPDAPLADTESELFSSASAVLRRVSLELREGGAADAHSAEVARFARAVAATRGKAIPPDRIVRIEDLYFADAGPHVVHRSPNPPMSPELRFRDDVAVRAEHVRRLVADAARATDPAGTDRAARELRLALRELEQVAASFGVHQVAAFFGEAARERRLLDATLLEAIDAGAAILLTTDGSMRDIEQRLALLERARRASPAPPPAAAPAAAPAAPPAATPVAPPATARTAAPQAPPTPPTARPAAAPATVGATPRRQQATPSGRELHDLLSAGIAAFKPLDDAPLSEPADLEPEEIVPIESLLYRGDSALARAIAVRDEMRARDVIDRDSLEEIFDLLDLVRTG